MAHSRKLGASMIVLAAAVWYMVVLAFLGIAMGFSPTLYAMTARFTAIHDSRHSAHLQRALIAGVIAAVVALFLLGGGAALALQQVWGLLGYNELSRYSFIAVVGVGLMMYGLGRLPRRDTRAQKPRAPRPEGRPYVKMLGVFLFSFSKTAGSVSGVWAAFMVYSMVASYNLSPLLVWLVMLPIVCVAAVLPFMLVVGSKHIAPTLHERAVRVLARVRSFIAQFQVTFLYGIIASGAALVAYAAIATTFWLIGA